ncbi:GtrA family protein [Pseudomonas sp. R-28-1W-6]|uniref:GtrA family protein n=1 Tax=Pseudomonas sp. R-28-1W-6 TaxID=2650101 RepID=UPI0013659A90|nr:GtrA family protein [Pseudomonas sp. R-28-1W-6]MWV10983.1 GtrA family protein [Pseudomonas sp. R-28-1W-6]
MKVAAIYALLAAIATAINIFAQALSVWLYSGSASIALSMMVGTGAGLIVKYVLDKRYIFRFKAVNAAHNGRIFLLYSLMGVFTTVIFWSTELAFHFIFQSAELRYLGGIIGLAIGYLTKYELDKRFVFRTPGVA